jgi:DNA-binding HxlR family transcriptional regulator
MQKASQMPYDARVTVTTVRLEGRMADRDTWTAGSCSLDKALQAVGSRSALLLMREAFYGATRFDELARRVGITEAVASSRLKELVELGLMERRPYQEPGQRTRQEYVLTEMGQDLAPAALALMQWGDRWLQDGRGNPVSLTHTDCGEPVRIEARCAADHHVGPGEVSARFNRSYRR